MRSFLVGPLALALAVAPAAASTRSEHGNPARGAPRAIVAAAAARNHVPGRLAHGVAMVESGYRCAARNPSGATGVGQVKPATARSVGVRGDLRDCRVGAEAMTRYLALAVRLARGGWCAAASLYNQGHPCGCTAYGRRVLRLAGLP